LPAFVWPSTNTGKSSSLFLPQLLQIPLLAIDITVTLFTYPFFPIAANPADFYAIALFSLTAAIDNEERTRIWTIDIGDHDY
jgi:hypothetical protein